MQSVTRVQWADGTQLQFLEASSAPLPVEVIEFGAPATRSTNDPTDHLATDDAIDSAEKLESFAGGLKHLRDVFVNSIEPNEISLEVSVTLKGRVGWVIVGEAETAVKVSLTWKHDDTAALAGAEALKGQ